MLAVLLAACSLSLAAADCSVNPDGSCAAPEVSECIGQCSRRQLNTSCLSVPGCTWNSSGCYPTDPTVDTMCANQVRSADCGATSGCYWSTKQCPTTQVCASNSTTTPDTCAGAGSNATGCATLGSQCQMKPKCSSECYNYKDEAGCTSLAGCFWFASVMTVDNGTKLNSAFCSECLLDPELNYFLLYKYMVGRSCTAPITNKTDVINILVAKPAATGCSGGDPVPLNLVNLVCTGAAASAGLTGTTSFLLAVISFAAFLNLN